MDSVCHSWDTSLFLTVQHPSKSPVGSEKRKKMLSLKDICNQREGKKYSQVGNKLCLCSNSLYQPGLGESST